VEINGSELPLNFPVHYSDRKFALYSWTESKVRISSHIKSIYKANETPMSEYLMAHHIINEKRKEALKNNNIGPIVMVAGWSSSGKTTLCNIFLNYAIKLGWNPTYVDLDLSNDIFTSGSISACTIDYPLPNDFLIDNAISLFHGQTNNEMNENLYELQVKEMADLVRLKLEHDLNNFLSKYNLEKNKKFMNVQSNSNSHLNTPNPYSLQNTTNISDISGESFICSDTPTLFASGAILNCPTFKENSKDKIYKTIIKSFNCDLIFIIENQRLYHELSRFYQDPNNFNSMENSKIPQICLLTKSRGVVSIDPAYKEYLDQKKFDIYFKGPFNNLKLNPFTLDLNIYKLLQVISSNLTQAILPTDSESDLNLILKEVNSLEENLVNRVLAIPHLDEKILNDLDLNFNKKLNFYNEQICRAPVAFLAYV